MRDAGLGVLVGVVASVVVRLAMMRQSGAETLSSLHGLKRRPLGSSVARGSSVTPLGALASCVPRQSCVEAVSGPPRVRALGPGLLPDDPRARAAYISSEPHRT